MASLKNQLATLAQSNPETGRLKNPGRRDSYIYSPSQAAKLTIDQVHQIGVDGFQQISLYDRLFQKFNQPLFGEATKRIDRTLLDPNEAKLLTTTIEEFLIRLSPYLLSKPSAHVLEWLVRRFRIHEFDVPTLVSIFLPYHDTPQFLAMLHIIRLDSHPHFQFLRSVQKSRTGLPHKLLIDAMITSPELLRYVTGILPSVTRYGPAHQALLGFHLHVFLGLFRRLSPQLATQQAFPQPILVTLLPVLVDGVQSTQVDTRLTHLIIISALARLSTLPRAVLQNLAKYVIEGHPSTDSVDPSVLGNLAWREHDEAMMQTLIVIFQNHTEEGEIRLSSKSCHAICRFFKVGELLRSMCETYEVSAFWKSLIQGLVKCTLKNEVVAEELVVKLAQIYDLPTGLVETFITESLSVLLPMEVPHRAALRPLGILFQRHPDLVEQIAQSLLSTSEGNAKESIPRILRLLSGDVPLTTDQCDPSVVGLSSSSAIVRQDSLKAIMEQMNANALDGSGSPSDLLNSALKTILKDPEPTTSELLLSFPQALLKAVKVDDIMSAATSILCCHQTPRSTLKHWLSFLMGPFLHQYPDMAIRVSEEIILARLFWTKSTAKSTSVFWTHVHDKNIWNGTILEGVWPAPVPGDSVESRITANESLLDGVGQNILKRGDSAVIGLLQKLRKDNKLESPTARLVPLLCLWSITSGLSGGVAGALMSALIDYMTVQTDSGGFNRWVNMDIGDAGTDRSILEMFYSKTSSEKLFSRLTASILTKAATQADKLKRPEYCWLEPGILKAMDPISSTSIVSQPSDIASFCFKLYLFSHSASHTTQQSLARMISGTLRHNILKQEWLTFLARVWTSSLFNQSFRVVALLDAEAEIKALTACSQNSDKVTLLDYQILIPSVMIALIDPCKPVRSAALSLTAALNTYLSSVDLAKKTSGLQPEQSIYAYDRFYGSRASADLQYLSIPDSTRLIALLHQSKTEISFDGLSRIRSILKNLEDSPTGASNRKRQAGCLRHRILCFFMKVIDCWNDFEGRVKLLKCISYVNDPVRIKSVAPLIDEMSSGAANSITDNNLPKEALAEYAALLFQTYDYPGKVFATGKDSTALDTLVSALCCSPANDAQLAIREAAKNKLQSGLIATLSSSQKQSILRRILVLASSSRDDVSFYVNTLRCLPLDSESVIATLSVISREISSNNVRSNKRTKTGKGSVGQATGGAPDLSELVTLLETISVEKLKHTFQLFAAFLDTLAILLATHTTHEVDIHFSAQLLISYLAIVAPDLDEAEFKSDGLPLSSIVDYMRISLDPHISHKIILLLADLARLCPELTCQSMMPIFTFVGAHVIQRDDAFSARVVDKAIQALSPPMVKASSASGSSRIELILSLRELLLMFVGARNHIPKHRRTRLFVRLIEVLGEYQFLGALLILMIDANIDEDNATSSFELPLAIWSSFPGPLGVAAIAHIVAEVETLLGLSASGEPGVLPAKTQQTEVDGDGDQIIEDESQELNTTRIQALMKFMSEALGSKSLKSKLDSARSTNNSDSDQVLAFLMMQILELCQPKPEQTESDQLQDARDIALRAAKLVSLEFFATAMLPKLQNHDSKLVFCTLDILRARLSSVKASQRPEIEMCVMEAIKICTNRIQGSFAISSGDAKVPLLDAIETLGDIAVDATASEQSLLSKAYGSLLSIPPSSNDSKVTSAALSALVKLCRLLGSRLIPSIGKTISMCVELVQKPQGFESDTAAAELRALAFRLVEATVKTLPAFLTPHMPIILRLITTPIMSKPGLQETVDVNQASLIRCLTKTVPLHNLGSVVSAYWSNLEGSSNVALALVEILLRAIKYAKVPEVIKESKAIFDFLLQIFDLRRQNGGNIPENDMMKIESLASSTFLSLVLKINDETLKPLLFRLIDWATITLTKEKNQPDVARSIALYKVFGALLRHLQTLAVSYFTHLISHTVTILNGFAEGKQSDFQLWTEVTSTLEQTLIHDTEGFWSATALTKITMPVINQIKLGSKFMVHQEYSSRVKSLIGKLAQKVSSHDTLLKVLNSGILQEIKARDDEEEDNTINVKLISLGVLEEIWKEIGAALVPFVPETIGGCLIEALEESHGGIDQAAKKVVKRIELEIGESIEGYLA
ncbi:snoRNA-binding rRNA-processing protein utp10 [Puccinia graminis f. sp. tritici]|uniref:U3 small nucleolar RNA-associated protein 10 n=1 Tax=Puccinia graminis f. sp. tritici TaxID=56615 RepID=A0A5B0LXQ5_PUCGR|nr:snoRNA-binding rRNA-processing protein utp10 [Puccinia graminis f. sp. tritici]